MTLASYIRSRLYEPEILNLDVDGSGLVVAHRAVLEKKPLLRSAFETFYSDMIAICDREFSVDGLEVELGSGVGFLKRMRPQVITSDVRPLPAIDRTIDAQKMNLADNSVRCIYAINVFHHLPEPDKFLSELCRVLTPGGGCILIEPHNGFSSRMLHSHLHKDEHFDSLATGWNTEEIRGPLSGANQALAYVVFERDRALFDRKYGTRLQISERKYSLNALRYLFSGGLNFRQLLPSSSEPLLQALEKAGKSWARHWSFHQTIVLRKL